MSDNGPAWFMGEADSNNSWQYNRLQDRSISEIKQNKNCSQCNGEATHCLTFGSGINTIKIRICKKCLKGFKEMLDKEFGETAWGVLKSIFGRSKEKVPRETLIIHDHS